MIFSGLSRLHLRLMKEHQAFSSLIGSDAFSVNTIHDYSPMCDCWHCFHNDTHGSPSHTMVVPKPHCSYSRRLISENNFSLLRQPIGGQHLANGGGPREERATHRRGTFPQHSLSLHRPSGQLLRPEWPQPHLRACPDAGWVKRGRTVWQLLDFTVW